MAVAALKSGAVDFIQKPYYDQNLLDSINNALEPNDRTRDNTRQLDALERHSAELTTREREVIELLLQGYTNKQTGKNLGISPRTVEVHRQHILRKYKVRSIAQLMYMLNKTVN
jgi:RNA polymerase sigma factor (sigma-70 family)